MKQTLGFITHFVRLQLAYGSKSLPLDITVMVMSKINKLHELVLDKN